MEGRILFSPRSKRVQVETKKTAVCYNWDKIGHYASECSDPDRRIQSEGVTLLNHDEDDSDDGCDFSFAVIGRNIDSDDGSTGSDNDSSIPELVLRHGNYLDNSTDNKRTDNEKTDDESTDEEKNEDEDLNDDSSNGESKPHTKDYINSAYTHTSVKSNYMIREEQSNNHDDEFMPPQETIETCVNNYFAVVDNNKKQNNTASNKVVNKIGRLEKS